MDDIWDLPEPEDREIEDGAYLSIQHHFLTRFKARGDFPGLVGRIGDLVSVDKKYDIVMSNIFSRLLDVHLVETYKDAFKGIEILTHYELGRGDFQARVTRRGRRDESNMYAPAANFPAERLFDKITFHDASLPQKIYNVIGDTLVVENIEKAEELDKTVQGKYPIVTLTGHRLRWPYGIIHSHVNVPYKRNRIRHNKEQQD